MRKTVLLGALGLLLSTPSFSQEKPKPLDLTFSAPLQPHVIAYTEFRATRPTDRTLEMTKRKDLLLPGARWTSNGVTYITGITPRKFVFRAEW
jgi:hypothetical protein